MIFLADSISDFLQKNRMYEVLGLFTGNDLSSEFVTKIEALIVSRDKARANKNWAKSDSIRDELSKLGIQIEDSPEGTKWRQI